MSNIQRCKTWQQLFGVTNLRIVNGSNYVPTFQNDKPEIRDGQGRIRDKF